MHKEANLLVLGDTETSDHDLILFVGKEPNNSLGRSVEVGSYGADWTESGTGTSCNFWNRMYSHAGATVGMSAKSLRGFCAGVGGSPLAVTDLSPLSLDGKFSIWEKKKFRKQISTADFEQHVEDVFSHVSLFGRVKLVWMVGHKGSGLDKGIPIFEAACRQVQTPFVHTAALDSTRHSNAQRLAQLGAAEPIVREVVSEFLSYNGFSAAA